MKKGWKRAVSVLLMFALSMSLLVGCGSDKDSKTDKEDVSGENGQSQGEEAGTGEEAGGNGVIDMEEEPYTVAIQVVTLPGTQFEGKEDREEAINAITVPAINCKVEIQEVWISEVANTTSMAVAGNEKIDLVHVATVNSLSSLVGSDILLDMNEDNILQTCGQDLVALFGDEILSGEVKGEQLAVPAKTFNANGKGFYYNKTMADECGVEILTEGFTLDDLEEALYQVHEKNPDVMPWFSGNGENNYLYWLRGFDGFGTQASYGAIMDALNDLTVENIFASDTYRDFVVRMQKWTADGLQPGDPTDTNSAQAYFQAGELFAVPSDINEMLVAQYKADNPDFEVEFAQMVEPAVTNATITEYMWGIASNSERPDKAMDFLNFLYTNGEVANILKYGLEGTNYEFMEGSDSVVAVNGTYIPAFHNGGAERTMYIQHPAGEDYIEKREAMESEATVSPILSYMFDDTEFQTESSVIYSTILEYVPRLANGMADSEEEVLTMLEEFNDKLKANGIEDVIAANQEQLDAYLAEHSN